MGLKKYTVSNTFFEGTAPEVWVATDSLQARLLCLKDFLKTVCLFPFALCFKLYTTFVQLFAVLVALFSLLFSLGHSSEARHFFLERFTSLAKDLADWLLFPLSLIHYSIRFLLGSLVHPAYYFQF